MRLPLSVGLFACLLVAGLVMAQVPKQPTVGTPTTRAPAIIRPTPAIRPIPQPDNGTATAKSSSDTNSIPSPIAPSLSPLQQPFPVQKTLPVPVEKAEPRTAEIPRRMESLDIPAELTPELLKLKEKIERVITIYEQRHQNTRENTNWEVMHAFVAFNVRTNIRRYGPNGAPVNAIGWILNGQPCNGQQLITLYNGRPRAEIGVGIQGHPGQLLAILAQSRVALKTPMKINGHDFILEDLLHEEQLDCRPNTELTFRLISFAHYLDLNTTWRASDGQTWDIPRIITEELRAPIRGAACGGTHRLFGLTYAYQQRIKRGEPLDGEYLRAKQYIDNYRKYAWSLMNADGSFSSEWFRGAGNRPDIDRKIQTTGHCMEWLILAQNNQELREPRMIRSLDMIATHLLNDPRREWKIGPLGHALHSLIMYNERVFNAPKVPAELVAKQQAADQRRDGTPINKPLPNDLEEINPFDMHPAEPDPGDPVPVNTAPPKSNDDQGQADEQTEHKDRPADKKSIDQPPTEATNGEESLRAPTRPADKPKVETSSNKSEARQPRAIKLIVPDQPDGEASSSEASATGERRIRLR